MSRRDAVYDRTSQTVFRNMCVHFVELAVLLMAVPWTKLVEEKGNYVEQLCYCTGSYDELFWNNAFGFFLTHSSILKEEKWRKKAIREVIVFWYVMFVVWYTYRGADKSLARPDWKNNWKVAIFRPTRSLLPRRPGWTDNFLNCFWVSCTKLEFGRCSLFSSCSG